MSNSVATPIRDDYIEPLEDAIIDGLKMLSLGPTDTATTVITTMQSFVDALLASDSPVEDMTSINLGALWGHAVVQQYGWQWLGIEWDDAPTEEPVICVVSPNNWYCVPPILFVDRIIGRHNINHISGESENTIAQLFEMLGGIEDNTPSDQYHLLA